MLKEFWTLAKMLFMSKPSEIGEVKLMGMEYFPLKGKDYLSWCGYLVYRKDEFAIRRKEWLTKKYKQRKQSENLLLEEAKQCGTWMKFYILSIFCKLKN